MSLICLKNLLKDLSIDKYYLFKNLSKKIWKSINNPLYLSVINQLLMKHQNSIYATTQLRNYSISLS